MVKGVTAFDWESYKNPEKILAKFRDSREYMDMVLVSNEGLQIPVHSVIISALSQQFWDTLMTQVKYKPVMTTIKTIDGTEFRAKQVEVPLTSHVLQAFVDSAYTGELHSDALQVWQVLDSADKFKIREVEKACCSFISKLVIADNCTEMYRMAVKHQHRRLFNASLDVIRKNFSKVLTQGMFFSTIDLDSLCRILASDSLNTTSEELVWTAIKKWVSFDLEKRKYNLPVLVKAVRILRTPPGFTKSLLSDPIVDDVRIRKDISKAITEAQKVLENRGESFPKDGHGLPVDPYLEYARPRIPHAVVLGIGGWKQSRTSKHVECFDSNTNQWLVHPNMISCPIRAYHGVEWFNNRIWMIGGTNGGVYMSTVDSWDPLDTGMSPHGNWKAEAAMTTKRCYVATAVCKGRLYAIGGHNGDFRLRSVEVYDSKQKTWEAAPDMIVNRSDGSACVIDDKIYMIGGLNENQMESTAEVFDPKKDTWTLLPEMTERRTSLAVVALNGYAYAIGGNNGETRLSSVERYDPRINAWTEVGSMNHGRSTFSATIMSGKIYVAGGYNGTSPISSVEVYDPESNVWAEITPMCFPRSGLALITLTDLSCLANFSFKGLIRFNNRRNRSRSPRIRVLPGNAVVNAMIPLPPPEPDL